jgi:hypothetical protein
MKKVISALTLIALLSASYVSAQTVYFDNGDVYYLKEGEQVFITDQEWVFTVEKGGYMRGLFEFYRILPLCEYYEPNDGLTFGGSAPAQPDCVSAQEAEEESQECDGFTFGGGEC